jgi:hypothetical protein
MTSGKAVFVGDKSRCSDCYTELAPHTLACPACGALVHADKLKVLAANAESATSAGELLQAREAWEAALRFLPIESQQYAAIRSRITDLSQRIDSATPASATAKPATGGSWWQRGGAAIVSVAVLLIGKLKFLLLGLTKASTFISMFAFFGVYWNLYGWPLAAGLVVSIYIHEMGHVANVASIGDCCRRAALHSGVRRAGDAEAARGRSDHGCEDRTGRARSGGWVPRWRR